MAEASRAAVAYLVIDVGKRSHSACALDEGGAVVFRAGLENRPDDIDRLPERAGARALVVVDQRRNIGALVLARAFAHGNPCAYLPGYAEKQARGMFPGVAKTDAIDADVAELEALVVDSLAGNEVYECPLTVPGIGPKTAAALATSIDVAMFRGHDELASHCGLVPADGRSVTGIRSVSPQRGGNKQLKNLLIFSCNSLIGTDNRFGRHYDGCSARGMRHNKALKAVARKRLKVIYAVMRDAAPYSA